MKRILYCLLLSWPLAAFGQDSINPYTIQQNCNIILQDTDVYYNPFAPPGDSDTRAFLSCRGDINRDPNGVGSYYGDYLPQVYNTVGDTFVALRDWPPHGTPIGPYATWQRLFQARDKPDHSHSDIIVGSHVALHHDTGKVTVSKNEDVDFRASGTIKMESGFHVMPGAFFHAYIEPKWGDTVFSDEFNDSAKFHNQWFIYNGHSATYNVPQSEYDTNVALDTDYEAHDGHALDISFHVNIDTFSCDSILELAGCSDSIWADSGGIPAIHKSITSTGYIRSCPFPSAPTGGPAYAHQPYGKYEVREKTPDLPHHTNFWGEGPQLFEWGAGETITTVGLRGVGWGHALTFGPYHGYFQIIGGDTLFISYDVNHTVSDTAPTGVITFLEINGFGYGVAPWHHMWGGDTVQAPADSPFPSSLAASHDTFTFYYGRFNPLNSDTVTWRVDTAGPGKNRYFHAPYHIRSGDSILFTRNYQPVDLTLTDSVDLGGHLHQKTYRCHWVDSLNEPNHGTLYMDVPLDSADLKTRTEEFEYVLPDQYANSNQGTGFGYRMPPYVAGADVSTPMTSTDSAAFATQPYRYHTIAMEWLPHEVRFLYDSVVVRRYPDRMIPPGDPYFNWVEMFGRAGVNIIPGEFDADDELVSPTSWAAPYTQNWFLSHLGSPGFRNGAAHHRLDYVKVFDVPKDVIIPGFPH